MKSLFLITLLSLSFKLSAQQSFVKVLSATDQTPLIYANVLFINNNSGTITDEDGVFSFDKKTVINDTIVVSHIGFEQYKCAVSGINSQIQLSPRTISLNEILVLAKSPKHIIEKSRDFVPINYPITQQSYLMSINHLISNDSSVLSVFDGTVICSAKNYTKSKPCEYRLYNVESFRNNRKTIGYTISYKSSAFPNNLIEQLFVNDLDFVANTKFYKYNEVENADNGDCYLIDFFSITPDSRHPYKGRITINKTDFAIVNIDYSVAAPNLITQNDVTIDLARFSKTKETHSVDSSKTELSFVKYNGRYHVSHFYNEYFYTHQLPNGKQNHYFARNEIVNRFGSVENITEYKPVSLYLYDLEEWNYDEQKRHDRVISKYYSKRINKILKELKEKYPDTDFDEFDEN